MFEEVPPFVTVKRCSNWFECNHLQYLIGTKRLTVTQRGTKIISAGIVSIIFLSLLITLDGQAPVKQLLSRHVVSKLFHFYVTLYLFLALTLLFWTALNWAWKSATFQSYGIIHKLENRITKLVCLLTVCTAEYYGPFTTDDSRYILRLMAIPPQNASVAVDGRAIDSLDDSSKAISSHKRYKSVPVIPPTNWRGQSRDSVELEMLKDLLFGSGGRDRRDPKDTMDDTLSPFQRLERCSTLFTVSAWTPLPSELMALASVFTLFAKLRVQGQDHLPRDGPCFIVVNHALGHGFDVPMLVYILRTLCNLQRVRVLVSPKHFNFPLWSDLAYYLGAVPRSHQLAEQLMRDKENIIMFAARKKRSAMIWDDSRSMYLDLVHKYDYKLVPAVCVSDEDVVNMVYDIRDRDLSKQSHRGNTPDAADSPYDTDCTDNEEEDMMSTFNTIRSRIRGGYRTQYHLRFSAPIAVPKKRKRRSSANKTGIEMQSRESTPSGAMEVRFSSLNLSDGKSLSPSPSPVLLDGAKTKENQIVSKSRAGGKVRKRRWSRELEIGLKTAVEDAMTDGISEMFNQFKNDPDSSMLETMAKKIQKQNQYINTLKEDIRTPTDVSGTWME